MGFSLTVVLERNKESTELGGQVLQGQWLISAPTSDAFRKQEKHERSQERNENKDNKVENRKRVLERIGHILRMPGTSQTKIAVLGWFKGLDGEKKTQGRKRKTHLYWGGILREAAGKR